MNNRITKALFVLAFLSSCSLLGVEGRADLHSTKFEGKRFSGFPDTTEGFGFLLGEPLLLRYSMFVDWKQAWSFSAGYSLLAKVAIGSVDYLFYGYHANDKIIDKDFWNSLIFYGGVGLKGGVGMAGSDPNDVYQVAGRLIGGIEYLFTNSPWGGRVEIVPEFFLRGKNNIGFAIGLGATYYFFDGGKIRGGTPTRVKEVHRESRPAPAQPSQTVPADF